MRKLSFAVIGIFLLGLAAPSHGAVSQEELTHEIWNETPVLNHGYSTPVIATNLGGYGNLGQAVISGDAYFIAPYTQAQNALYKVASGTTEPVIVTHNGEPILNLAGLSATSNHLVFSLLQGSGFYYTTLNTQTDVLTVYDDYLVPKYPDRYNTNQIVARNGRVGFFGYATNLDEPRLIVHELASDQFWLYDHSGQDPYGLTFTDDHFFYFDEFVNQEAIVVGSLSSKTILARKTLASGFLEEMYALENDNILLLQGLQALHIIDTQDPNFTVQALLDTNSNPVAAQELLDIEGGLVAINLDRSADNNHLAIYDVQRTQSGVVAVLQSEFDFSVDNISTLGASRFIPGTTEMLIFPDSDAKLFNYDPSISGDARRNVTIDGEATFFGVQPISTIPLPGGALVVSDVTIPLQNLQAAPSRLYALNLQATDLVQVAELNPGQTMGALNGLFLYETQDLVLSTERELGGDQRIRLFKDGVWTDLYEGVQKYLDLGSTAQDGFYFSYEAGGTGIAFMDESGIQDFPVIPTGVFTTGLTAVGENAIFATWVDDNQAPVFQTHDARVWMITPNGVLTELFDFSSYAPGFGHYRINGLLRGFVASYESNGGRYASVSRTEGATPSDVNVIVDSEGNIFQKNVLSGANVHLLGSIFEFHGQLYGSFRDQSAGTNFLATIELDSMSTPASFSYEVVTPIDQAPLPLLKVVEEIDGAVILTSADYALTDPTQLGLWRLDDSGLRRIAGTERQIVVVLSNAATRVDGGLLYVAFSFEEGFDPNLVWDFNYSTLSSKIFLLDESGSSTYIANQPGATGFSSLAHIENSLFMANYTNQHGPVISRAALRQGGSSGFTIVPLVRSGPVTWINGSLIWRLEVDNADLLGAKLDDQRLQVSNLSGSYEIKLPETVNTGVLVTLETTLGDLTVSLPRIPELPAPQRIAASIKRTGDKARVLLSSIIGVGKVQVLLNGREVAWVRAIDGTDPKLRRSSDLTYFVRSIDLQQGKNRIEVRLNGERVRLVTYSK